MNKNKWVKWNVIVVCVIFGCIFSGIIKEEIAEARKERQCNYWGCEELRMKGWRYCEEHHPYFEIYTPSTSASASSRSSYDSYEECVHCEKPQTPKTIYCYEHACEIYGQEIVDGLRDGTMSVKEAMKKDIQKVL